MKIVTFCGHSELSPEELLLAKNRLHIEIERLVEQGATEFLLGGYGNFDLLAAMTVKKLKSKYPYMKSILVIPYIDKVYDKDLYDCSEYPPIELVPKPYAILKRNEYMVKESDAVIAFVKYSWGGAAKTLTYAQRKKKHIINIANLIDG